MNGLEHDADARSEIDAESRGTSTSAAYDLIAEQARRIALLERLLRKALNYVPDTMGATLQVVVAKQLRNSIEGTLRK